MTIRGWVQNRFIEDGIDSTPIGTDALAVSSDARQNAAIIVVPDPGSNIFGVPQLESILREHGNVDSVLLIRRPADEAVFTLASDLGIQIDTLGNVVRALHEYGKLSRFQHPNEVYLRSCIGRLPTVLDIHRIGFSAWSIERSDTDLLLKIITHDRYEFPVSELRSELDRHPTIRPDAVVITNPNASGFSTQVKNISQELDIRLLILRDFIDCIKHGTI